MCVVWHLLWLLIQFGRLGWNCSIPVLHLLACSVGGAVRQILLRGRERGEIREAAVLPGNGTTPTYTSSFVLHPCWLMSEMQIPKGHANLDIWMVSTSLKSHNNVRWWEEIDLRSAVWTQVVFTPVKHHTCAPFLFLSLLPSTSVHLDSVNTMSEVIGVRWPFGCHSNRVLNP